MPSLAVVPHSYRGVTNKGDIMRLADLFFQYVDVVYKLVVIAVGLGIPVVIKRLRKPLHAVKQKIDVLSQMAEQFDPANNEGKTLKETILQIKSDTEALIRQRESRITKVEEELKSLAQDRRDRIVVVDERFDKQDRQITKIERLMHLQNEKLGIKEPTQLHEEPNGQA